MGVSRGVLGDASLEGALEVGRSSSSLRENSKFIAAFERYSEGMI